MQYAKMEIAAACGLAMTQCQTVYLCHCEYPPGMIRSEAILAQYSMCRCFIRISFTYKAHYITTIDTLIESLPIT